MNEKESKISRKGTQSLQKSSEPQAGPSSVKPVHHGKCKIKDKFIVQLLHKKCCVIQKTRSQISELENKYCREGCVTHTRFRGVRYYCNKFKQIFCCLLLPLCFLILAWFCILYGAYIGGVLCSESDFSYIPFQIPGIRTNNKCGCECSKAF